MTEHIEDRTGLVLAESVRPVVEAVRAFVVAAQELRATTGMMPSPESVAMSEIAADAKFAGGWGDGPLTFAHHIGTFSLSVAEDQVLDICDLATATPGAAEYRPPIYGLKTLTRAVLEAAGRSAYLLELPLDPELRVYRGIAERLYSADQLARAVGVHDPDAVTRFETLKASVEAEADRRDVRFRRDRTGWYLGEESRPTNTAIVRRLLDDASLAGLAYGFYAGTSHSVFWATSQSIDRSEIASQSPLTDQRAIKVDSGDLAGPIVLAAMAYRDALVAGCRHHGWPYDTIDRLYVDNLFHAVAGTPGFVRDRRPAPTPS